MNTNRKRNSNLTTYSKNLRRDMTKEERHLWYGFLKKLPITVHRQYVIGSYIADYYIASKLIVIELDGSEHFTPENKEYDCKRNEYMESLGITVLRYKNIDVNNNFYGVCRDIMKYL